jgi:Bax protein
MRARLANWFGAALPVLVMIGAAMALPEPPPVPEFRDYPAGAERKQVFFDYFHPLIVSANDRVQRERELLVSLAGRDRLRGHERRWLEALARRYRVAEPEGIDSPELIARLLRRVDVVPPSLALAQAAKESGWGTSRFAREANNYFGEWCYTAGCGLVPQARGANRRHEVESFRSPAASVASYLRNINTHEAYQGLRERRAALRSAGQKLTGIALAAGLSRYSERREAYVEEIRALIRHNDLVQFDAAHEA